ncbi:hypothetical protein [Halobacillus litoralis]|uniref:hypothetical protein n=1 Tax=Halobacillus litoralis TaxID=45668 RepID=UPI001CD64ACE|nr:hypothetical protein [Halobacillus litoralis]MCA1021510.1 hypothetical protein [Halobacillus litoralis]
MKKVLAYFALGAGLLMWSHIVLNIIKFLIVFNSVAATLGSLLIMSLFAYIVGRFFEWIVVDWHQSLDILLGKVKKDDIK